MFAAFLQRFGAVAPRSEDPDTLERLARLFWFTVEFGLIRESGKTRLYGSGLISSHADAENALGPGCDRRPFRLEEVLEQPFRIDDLQPVLYVVEDFAQLFEAVARLETDQTLGAGPAA